MKKQVAETDLRLMVFESAKELGEKVNEHLLEMYKIDKEKDTFIIPIKEIFFEDGHSKVEIEETVRGKDVFFITDIGNYSVEYKMHGFINHASPNDILMQLKDGLGACNSHAKNKHVVMPLLFNARQHRRNSRENLSCGMNLYELDELYNVRSFITFDAHDQGVEHAIHNMEFDNYIPSNTIIAGLINDLPKSRLKKIVFIAPDNGATGRRNIYLNSFNSPHIHKEAGSFVKQRDFNNFVDGKYPIISHDYIGNQELEGYTAIISDDMISSGSSIFDCIDELNKRNIQHIYICSTYALFTKGIDKFDAYYKDKKFAGVYTTNLSYIPKEYSDKKWLHVCDCSLDVAKFIYNIHNNLSTSELLRDRTLPSKLLEQKFTKSE